MISRIIVVAKNSWSSEGLRTSVLVSGGNIFGAVLSGIAMLLLSRILGPGDFGVFSAAFSLLLLVSRIADIGVNLATQRAVSREHSSKFIRTLLAHAVLVKLILSLLLILIGCLGADYIASEWLRMEQVRLVRASFVFASFTIAYEFYLSTIQALHRFGEAALIAVSQGIVKLGVVGGMAAMKILNVEWAFYLYGLAPGLILLNASAYVNYISSLFRYDPVVARELWRASKWTSLAIVSSALADNIDVLLVQRFLSAEETGLFSAASRITLLINLVSLSLITVLSVRVAKYKEINHLNAYLRKAKWLAIASLVGSLLLIPMSGLLIFFTVGEAYQGSSVALAWLLVSTGLATATGPFTALFYLFDRPDYYAWSGLLLMVSIIAFDAVLIPLWGIDGAGMAKLLARFMVLVFTLGYVWWCYRNFKRSVVV